jgi:hypothetical protein
VTSPSDHRPSEPRSSIRTDARLDAMTRAKVNNLARHFHTPRAAVLSHIMHWGVSHKQPETLDQGESQGPVRHLYLYVASALHERVEKAAIATGMKIAPWLRRMVRQITITDFPLYREKSHVSRTYPL